MALINCPECGKEISDKAVSCPNCGLPLKNANIIPNNHNSFDNTVSNNSTSKKSPTLVIVLCIAIGCIYFLWMIIGVLGNSNKNEHDDYYSNNKYQSYTTSTTESKLEWYTQRNEDLDIVISDVYSNSSYSICEGTISNNGSSSYRYIKIKGSFMNKSGEVLDTDWTYGIGSEGLSPGETTSFRLSVDKNTEIVDCKITYISD